MFENNIWGSDVNGSLWCLPVEFLLYLVTPVYISIGMKISDQRKKYYYGIVTLLIIIAGSVWTTWLYDTSYVFRIVSYVMQIIPYYFVGVLIAACNMEKNLNTQVAIVLMFIIAGLYYLPAPFCHIGQYIFIPYVIMSLALEEKPVFAAFNKRDISYGMFLFGFVIQQVLIQIFIQNGYPLNTWILLALTLVFDILMGAFTERFIEIPSRKMCRRILLLFERRLENKGKK